MTARTRLVRLARKHGWKVTKTAPDRLLFTKGLSVLVEVRFEERRGRVLDAIYYNRFVEQDQYIMFGDFNKAGTLAWIFEAQPLDLGPRHQMEFNRIGWERAYR